MSRYFLHIENSTGFTVDEDGEELPSLDAARARAMASVRSFVADEVREGRIDLRGRIHVADDTGATALVIPFIDAIELRAGPPPAAEERGNS